MLTEKEKGLRELQASISQGKQLNILCDRIDNIKEDIKTLEDKSFQYIEYIEKNLKLSLFHVKLKDVNMDRKLIKIYTQWINDNAVILVNKRKEKNKLYTELSNILHEIDNGLKIV